MVELFLQGTITTLQATLAAFVLALLFGIFGAACKLSHYYFARLAASIYTYIFRGIPELITVMAFILGVALSYNNMPQH